MAWWPNLPNIGFYLGILILAIFGSIWAVMRSQTFGLKAGSLCFGWVVGFCWCGWVAHMAMADRWPRVNDTQEVNATPLSEIYWVEGQVVGLPMNSGDSLRFEFATHDRVFPRRLLVRWHRPNAYVVPGQHWRLPLRIEAPLGRLNFGGFDYEQYLLAEGIGGLARVSTSAHRAQLLGQSNAMIASFNQIRQVLAEKIQAKTASLEVAALKRALLIGDRQAISAETREVLEATGTAHLLAISGLHVSMVAGFGMGLGSVVWMFFALSRLQIPRRRVMVSIGWLAGLGYAGLAGFSLPTQRAVLMLTVLALALLWQRRIQPFDGWLAAAFLVLLINPLAALSVGFWLSFLAVAFLIWGFAWRTGSLRRLQKVRGLIGAQLILSVGLWPLNVGVFGQWAPTAFLANLVAIPWVGFLVLPSLLVSALIEELRWSMSVISWVSDESLALLMQFLGWLAGFDFGPQTLGFGTAWAIVFALIGATWLLSPSGWPGRWVGLALMGPLAMSALPSLAQRSDIAAREMDQEALRVSVLDVGSGLALIAETNHYRLMYGTGPGDGVGQDAIGDVLGHWPWATGSTGRMVIDDLVLSHAHRAHVGGLGAIGQWAWVRRAHIPPGMTLDPTLPIGQIEGCRRGQRWIEGPWTFEVVHPGQHLPDLGGNSGCVLWVHSTASSMLIAGGLDAIGEAHVMQMVPDLKADVLMIARSGHEQTTSEVWVKQIDPRMALISVSANDAYGRPADALLNRLDEFDVRVLQTSQCGALRLTLNAIDPEILVETSVANKPRFWRNHSNC